MGVAVRSNFRFGAEEIDERLETVSDHKLAKRLAAGRVRAATWQLRFPICRTVAGRRPEPGASKPGRASADFRSTVAADVQREYGKLLVRSDEFFEYELPGVSELRDAAAKLFSRTAGVQHQPGRGED